MDIYKNFRYSRSCLENTLVYLSYYILVWYVFCCLLKAADFMIYSWYTDLRFLPIIWGVHKQLRTLLKHQPNFWRHKHVIYVVRRRFVRETLQQSPSGFVWECPWPLHARHNNLLYWPSQTRMRSKTGGLWYSLTRTHKENFPVEEVGPFDLSWFVVMDVVLYSIEQRTAR